MVVGVVLWLNTKFNAAERLVFKEVMRTRNALMKLLTQHHLRMEQHSGRIMRLELAVFRSTLSGQEYEGKVEPDVYPDAHHVYDTDTEGGGH